FTLNCVVTRQNLDALRPLVDLVMPYRDVVLKFSMVQPKGGGDHAFAQLMPRVADVAARVGDAIAYGEAPAQGGGPGLGHDGLSALSAPRSRVALRRSQDA